MRSMSWPVSLPPLPWPSRISSRCATGSGQSENGMTGALEDIVLAQGDVGEIPQEMQQQRVRFLHAVDRPRADGEAELAHVGHARSVATGEADRQQPVLLGAMQGAIDVGGGARR